MRFAVFFVLATVSGSALAQHQEKGDICAEDVDCKGEQICVRQVCVMPPEPEKPAPAAAVVVVTAPASRAEFSLAPQVGFVSESQNDASSTHFLSGAILTNAYTVVPALAVVLTVDFRYTHPTDGELDRYLSIEGGLRLQNRSRAFAIDLLVGWTQLFNYSSVGGVSQNSSIDGTALGVLAHFRFWGPLEAQGKVTENIFAGFKAAEVSIGVGVRI
jgi:hypothetical protein